MRTTNLSPSPTAAGADGFATLLRQYGCGPIQFTGTQDALYDRHLLFDNVMKLATAGPRERFEASGASRAAWWMAGIQAELDDRSMIQLREDAEWFRRREPNLICFPTRPAAFDKIQPGDRVVVFDYSGGGRKTWMRVASVVDPHDYPRTPDGGFFLVNRYRKRGRKRLTKKYVQSLVDRGFIRTEKMLRRLTVKPLAEPRRQIIEQDIAARSNGRPRSN
jgi:hypothetical protein